MGIPEVREKISWVPLKLQPTCKTESLGRGTGFVYELDGRSFLVTNYHVVSGINPQNSMCLDKGGRIPDSLTIGVPYYEKRGAVQWKWKKLSLYGDDAQLEPIWHEHPDHGRDVDIAAIPLNDVGETHITTANSPALDLDKLRLTPGLDAFVIGFPRGMSGGAHFPLWKRATIASEPDIDIDGLPKFYIDTATREGMSGSPVFAQEVGYWLPEGESDPKKAVIGRGRRFVGVYSGRLGAEDEYKSQLGLVWKEQALIEILQSIPSESGHSIRPQEE